MAPPGILGKRKEGELMLAARLEASKAADPPGRCQQRAGFEATTKAWPPSCDAWPGPRPRSPLGPGAPSKGASPCAGPLRVEVGDAGAGGPASGEGQVHGIFRKLLKSAPGCFSTGQWSDCASLGALLPTLCASAARRPVIKFRSKGCFTQFPPGL